MSLPLCSGDFGESLNPPTITKHGANHSTNYNSITNHGVNHSTNYNSITKHGAKYSTIHNNLTHHGPRSVFLVIPSISVKVSSLGWTQNDVYLKYNKQVKSNKRKFSTYQIHDSEDPTHF
uniref:Uncharacterized protein n=1 Tax=Cacopsylla melanoneura TaxID=428564 RepID=A0A8D9DUQ5_9HEMI